MKRFIWLCLFLIPLQGSAQFADLLSIDKFTITAPIQEKGVTGLRISAYIHTSTTLPGWDTTTWYAFPEIINSQQKVVFSPAGIPGTYKTTIPRNDYARISFHTKYPAFVSFFIPFRRILDNPGKQTFTFQLSVCNVRKTKTEALKSIISQELTLPESFFISIDLKKAVAQEGIYDEPGKNIPLLGMFFGNKSKTGKGYPDIVWDIRIGSDIIFESEEATNDFNARPGRAVFRITDSDPVVLSVWDNDDFSSDDLIGSKKLQISPGPYTQHVKNDVFDKVISSEYIIHKVRIPSIDNISVSSRMGKYQGVSGVFISSYQHISDDAPVSIRPIFTNAFFTQIHPIEFVKIVYGSFSPSASGMIQIPSLANDSLVLFIPHYAMHNNMYPAIQYFLEGHNVLIKQRRTDKIFDPLTDNDIGLQTTIEESALSKGIYGIKINSQIKVPDMYHDDLDPFDFYYNIKITTTDGQDITSLFEPLNRLRDTGYSHIKLIRLQKDLSFFMPYYKMREFNYANRFVITLESRMKNNHLMIGYFSDTFEITIPPMLQLPHIHLSVNNQHSSTQSYQYVFFHGEKEVTRSEIIKDGKQKTVIRSDGRFVHPNDHFKIELQGKNSQGEIKILGTWSNKGELFLSNKFIRMLSTGKSIKKGKMQFAPFTKN